VIHGEHKAYLELLVSHNNATSLVTSVYS